MARSLTQESISSLEGHDKSAAVQSMFAEIAPTYDRVNGLMSFSLHHRWRAAAVNTLQLQSGSVVLDLCCGTGDFFMPIRRQIGQTGQLIGLDFCGPMLELSESKDEAAQVALADACHIPMPSASVDGVTVGWGIRNVRDIDGVHREIARVLKSGGRFVSIDMAVPRSKFLAAIAVRSLKFGLSLMGSLLGHRQAYAYLPNSAEKFRTREELKASMEAAGMLDVGYRDFMMGNICMHYGRKP